MPEAINARESRRPVMTENLADIVGVVIIEDEDTPGWRLEHYGIGIFAAIAWFHGNRV